MSKIILYKSSQRTLSRQVIMKQLEYGRSRAVAGNRGKVWEATIRLSQDADNGEIVYKALFNFRRTGRSIPASVEQQQIGCMTELLERALRSRGWGLVKAKPERQVVINTDGLLSALPDPDLKQQKQGYAEVKINTDPGSYFSHLYDREAQVSLVLSAVEEYARSNFVNRFHCVLYGEPACAKTEILRGLTKMLGQDAVMHFDATSTTSAGAKQLLTEADNIPPVLCIEEIEKADEASLRWLLGVLDYRAEIRALKFRSGLVAKTVKLLCLATVNDFGLFNKMLDGALASRFSHKIYCPRPSRQVLKMILEREVAATNGNVDWIEPALDYCINTEKTNDPRRIITVCLCGRDRLLDGSYQKLLGATIKP